MLICSCCYKEWGEDDPCGDVPIINADIEVTGKGPDAVTVFSDGDKMFTGDGHWVPVYAKVENPVNRGRANEDSLKNPRIWHFRKDCPCKHR